LVLDNFERSIAFSYIAFSCTWFLVRMCAQKFGIPIQA
jgi:hypothetical protein